MDSSHLLAYGGIIVFADQYNPSQNISKALGNDRVLVLENTPAGAVALSLEAVSSGGVYIQ
ncbi:MAG: hypothetical protein MUF52_01570 [Syntrophobacteraceae bacterium]|jgi:hypothetical protein|nr:hypothetical protein [Syntrophobacteraceae bacterium]